MGGMAQEASGRRSRTLQVRVTPGEEADLREVARGKGISVSQLLRDGALKRRVPREKRVVPLAPRKHRGAAELERGGLVKTGTFGSGSVAPPAVFRCPIGSCGPEGEPFESGSPKAVCPAHGRKVVPA